MVRHSLLLLVILALLLACRDAWAQDTPPSSPAGAEPPLMLPAPVVLDDDTPAIIPVPREGVPPSPTGDVRPGRLRLSAERIAFNPELGDYRFFGSVVLETAQITIYADELTYLDERRQVVARGNVSIRAEDGNVYWGNVLEYNLRTEEWSFIDWSAEFPPAFLGAPFIAPVFVQGQNLTGMPSSLCSENAHVTTCDLPAPHFEIVARRVDIIPGDKVIARDCDLYVLGRRIIRVPWFYLSLKDRRSPFVPEVGRNDVEGYFLRVLYQYVINEDNIGGIRVDLTEKRGIGLGVNHFYTIPQGEGELFLYGREGGDEYVARLDHTQLLPQNIKTDLTANFRQNSFETTNISTATDITLTAQRPTQHSSTLLTFRRNLTENIRPGAEGARQRFYNDTTGANFRYTLNTAGGSVRYSADYNSFGSGSDEIDAPANEELWSRLQLSRNTDVGRLTLNVDNRFDPDGDKFIESSYGVERLPEVVLETTQEQLRWNLLTRVPTSLQLGWGIFDEQVSGSTERQRLNRYLFNINANPRPIALGASTLTPVVRYRQTLYGDEDATAYYYLTTGATLRTNFNRYLSNVVTYNRQRVDGYTPFTFDRAFPSHTVTEGLQYESPRLKAYLNTGRDIQNNRWQNLTVRTEAQLTDKLLTRQSFYYDLNDSRWGDLTSQFVWRDAPHLTLDVSSRYDLHERQLKNVSSQVAWVINPQWRMQWLSGYDGFTKQFSYNEFLVTRDLHCWDVSLYYSTQEEYVYLYFRLKALNLPLPLFGIGSSGQVLVPSVTTPF